MSRKLDANIPLYADPAFRTVCEMEDRVSDCEGLVSAILHIATGQTGLEWRSVYALTHIALKRLEKIEKARGKLFNLTHPSRADWEAAGGKKEWRKQLQRQGAEQT